MSRSRIHFDKPEHPATSWAKGRLTSIFIVSAGVAGAFNADNISGYLVDNFADKHEAVVVTDARYQAIKAPVYIGNRKTSGAFSFINDPHLGTTSDAPAAEKTAGKIDKRDLPSSLVGAGPQAHILWAKFHIQEARNKANPPVERLQALLLATSYVQGSELSEKDYFETISLTQDDFYESLGTLSKDAIEQLKHELSRTAPNDLITRSQILEEMAGAYKYIGTTKKGMPVDNQAYEENVRATGLEFEKDIIAPLDAMKETAAQQGYSEVSRYSGSTPRNDMEWKRYNDSYMVLTRYVEIDYFGQPTTQESRLAAIGLTSVDWEKIKIRDEMLNRQKVEKENAASAASPFQNKPVTPGS